VHPKVVGRAGWEVVSGLAASGLTTGWTLAGGTALALQLGHRVSHDLDFFRAEPFDAEALLHRLAGLGRVTVQGRAAETLHVTLDRLRLSYLRAQAPLLFPGTPYRDLVLADPRDIAVMKVIAIGGRGSRKDFVDLYFYLRGGGTLQAVFGMMQRRFPRLDHNEYHLLRSLVYFDDAETEPMPRLIRRVGWREIKAAIVAEVRRLA